VTSDYFYEAMRNGARLILVGRSDVIVQPGSARGEVVPHALRRTKNYRLFLAGYYIYFGGEDCKIALQKDGSVSVTARDAWPSAKDGDNAVGWPDTGTGFGEEKH
jgi:hypothetical protein